MKVIVRAPNWIGDQVLAFPFFFLLRKAYPKAEITSVCVPWVKDLQYVGLIDRIETLVPATQSGVWNKFKAIDQCAHKVKARGPYDLGFSLPHSLGSAWLLARAGVKRRIGYRGDGRSLLLNEPHPFKQGDRIHRAQEYVQLLPSRARQSIDISEFWGRLPDSDLDPREPGVLDSFDFQKYWQPAKPLKTPDVPYWVLAPGATAESRRWKTSAFARLARLISDRLGMRGVIVGGLKETRVAQELCEDRSLGLIDQTAECSVPELAPLFSNAKFTVTNESGLAHVASLCGSFVQIICGAADPIRTRPLGPGRVQVMVNPIDCWPCEKNVCVFQEPGKKNACLTGIQPEQVIEEIERGLKKPQVR